MEKLNVYLTYNNDPEVIKKTFETLDKQMKLIHDRGYHVKLNSSTIEVTNGEVGFASFISGASPITIQQNIEDLAKLAVGAYFSLPTGVFTDYTLKPTDFFREHFDEMEGSILKNGENDNYYRDVLVLGKNTKYYCTYMDELSLQNGSKGKDNARVLTKSTPQGKAMTPREDAAFVDIIFYPLLTASIALIAYIAYVLF